MGHPKKKPPNSNKRHYPIFYNGCYYRRLTDSCLICKFRILFGVKKEVSDRFIYSIFLLGILTGMSLGYVLIKLLEALP